MSAVQAAKIAPDLARLVAPITRLRLHPDNPNEGDVGSIASSMEEFTQYKPVVAQRSTGRVLAGNHTYLAAMGLGWQEIAVVFLDVDDLKAKAILAGDNQHQKRSRWNVDALGPLLSELAQADALAGTGFDGDDVDALLREIERDQQSAPLLDGRAYAETQQQGASSASAPISRPPAESPDEFREYNELTLTTQHECPRCSYRW